MRGRGLGNCDNSTKALVIKIVTTGVENCPKLRDVIYGRLSMICPFLRQELSKNSALKMLVKSTTILNVSNLPVEFPTSVADLTSGLADMD